MNNSPNKTLSAKQLLLMGGALFSMHFGASCMLYPVTWGKDSGSSVFIAYIAIILTALLLPLLGYIALSRGKGSFYSLTKRLSPKFASVFCGLTVLIMGPLYVTPRMSAASWDALVQLTGIQTNSIIPILLFNIVFYAVTYWFLAGRSDTMDKIGKILFPILIVIVIGVIGKGLITPIAPNWQPKSYPESPLVYGFLQGYQTGDLPAALMFGLVTLQGISNAGIRKEHMNRNLVMIGFIGMGMLALTHLGHMIVGASTGGTIDLMLSALYAEVVLQLWGSVGAIFFNIALIFAALTTAVGLAGSTAEYFDEALGGKFSYKQIVLATVIICVIVSTLGLNNVVTFIGPLLDACYPATIVLVIYYVLVRNNTNPKYMNGARFAIIAAALTALLDVAATYNTLFGINSQAYISFYSAIPLSSVKLTWIPVSAIFFILGLLLYRPKQDILEAEV